MPCPRSLGKPVAGLGVETPQSSCPVLVGKQHLGCFCGVENGQVLSTFAATQSVEHQGIQAGGSPRSLPPHPHSTEDVEGLLSACTEDLKLVGISFLRRWR